MRAVLHLSYPSSRCQSRLPSWEGTRTQLSHEKPTATGEKHRAIRYTIPNSKLLSRGNADQCRQRCETNGSRISIMNAARIPRRDATRKCAIFARLEIGSSHWLRISMKRKMAQRLYPFLWINIGLTYILFLFKFFSKS